MSCADGHQDDILPGCTHMQPAQPVSLAHHLLAYAWMFRRDCMRLDDVLKRVRISPLGSAALAGTTYPLDPQSVADEVGFDGIYGNSMDAVSDRDFVLEALFAGSCIMAHLSRLCEELIIWANPAFGFVQLSDGYSTGSSIMPQKKNPDVAELMRGKTGRVYGSLMGMLTIMKGLPMTYNRDLQEDKEGFLDADRTVDASLMLMAGMLEELTFRTDRMRAACARGFLNATELADYLVGKGLPFREAHHVTGHAVALAEKQGKGLEDLSLAELQQLDARIADDVYAVLDYAAAVRRRETPAGTGPVPWPARSSSCAAGCRSAHEPAKSHRLESAPALLRRHGRSRAGHLVVAQPGQARGAAAGARSRGRGPDLPHRPGSRPRRQAAA